MSSTRWISLLALAVTALACSDSTGPVTRPDDALHFVTAAPGAPVIANPVVTFWAHNDRDNEARISYLITSGGETEDEDLLDFRIPAGSLARYPDGTPFGAQDSVLITITVIDAQHLVTAFSPAGLAFSTSTPARLRYHLGETDDDLNDDGAVDGTDAELETQLRIWRQEAVGEPWAQLSSHVELSLDEIEADITGFTNYAVAY